MSGGVCRTGGGGGSTANGTEVELIKIAGELSKTVLDAAIVYMRTKADRRQPKNYKVRTGRRQNCSAI